MRSFTIPDGENSITAKDIANGRLRITVTFKDYFPSESCEIAISYGDEQTKTISFYHRVGRSHVLSVGKDFMNKVQLKPGNRVKVTELAPRKHYLLEKL